MPGLSTERSTVWVLVVVQESSGTLAPADLEYWQITDTSVIRGAAPSLMGGARVGLVARRLVVDVPVMLDF